MGMNTNNLRLSSTSTKQLERMIDDAAWLTLSPTITTDRPVTKPPMKSGEANFGFLLRERSLYRQG